MEEKKDREREGRKDVGVERKGERKEEQEKRREKEKGKNKRREKEKGKKNKRREEKSVKEGSGERWRQSEGVIQTEGDKRHWFTRRHHQENSLTHCQAESQVGVTRGPKRQPSTQHPQATIVLSLNLALVGMAEEACSGWLGYHSNYIITTTTTTTTLPPPPPPMITLGA
ncbi:hypothetical protein Pcinc_030086 [Petrolisthes cinctipes]|uniref:Uncharacterized protein n=1 Tax=Petrolisthes cinctipes TaxID=88211 RepID=A0AAE1F017_PETCI|nr:hypothetical protein Pcinc_030086 [Petrolisthes cinctipes]